jgi:hypothetical protein
MPSLVGSTVATNYLKNVRANGLGPRTVIVSISKTDITDTQLNTIINYMTSAQGSSGTGDSAFVVAGLAGSTTGGAFVAGTTDVVYVALQGTGTITVGADYAGVTGATTAVVATFDQNYQ